MKRLIKLQSHSKKRNSSQISLTILVLELCSRRLRIALFSMTGTLVKGGTCAIRTIYANWRQINMSVAHRVDDELPDSTIKRARPTTIRYNTLVEKKKKKRQFKLPKSRRIQRTKVKKKIHHAIHEVLGSLDRSYWPRAARSGGGCLR